MRWIRSISTTLLALCLLFSGTAPLPYLGAQGKPVTLILTEPPALADVYSPKFLGEFEATHPGITVQINKQNPAIVAPAFDLDQHFEAVQKYVTSGDVLYVTTGTIFAEDAQAGYFLDQAPLVNADKTLNPADFYPAIWQSYQWESGIWALPASADPIVVQYNPDAFDKAGVSYPSGKWTADDLIDAAHKLTVRDSSGKVSQAGIDLMMNLPDSALRALVKNSLIDTSTSPNSPKFATLAMAELVDKWCQLDEEGAVGSEFAKAPLSIAPAIWLTLTGQLAPGEKRVAAMLPGGQAALNVDGFAISGGTQHPEQAYALASWLTTRGEAANNGLASTPARQSLKGAPGSEQFAFKLDISPEVQAIIDEAVVKGIPISEMRFADYVASAYNRTKKDKVDALAALQQAESEAVKAQRLAVEKRAQIKAALIVATPVSSSQLASGKIALKFAIGASAPIIPNKDTWTSLVAGFTARDERVTQIIFEASADPIDKLAAKYDCFYLPYNALAPDKLAKLIPLDPFLSADSNFDKPDMVGDVLSQVTRDHKIYALPVDLAPDIFKYDATAFEKAGILEPSLVWTTDAFADALKILKAYNGDQPAFVPVNTFGSYLMNLIVAYGGLPIDYRTTPPTVNFTDPATMDAIRQVMELARKDYFRYHPLFSGQLDLVINPEPSLIKAAALSPYALSSLLGGGNNDKFKVTLYPRGSKSAAVSFTIGTLYISATTSNPEACYRWISTVSKYSTLFGSMPARRSQLDDPALAAAQGTEVDAVYKQIAHLLQDPNTISLPGFSAASSLSDSLLPLELYKALDRYMAKDSSVELESVLKDAEGSAKAFLGCSASIPPLDMTSTDSQKAYYKAARACAVKADPDLAPFFAGVTAD